MLTTRGMQNSKATGSCVYTKAKLEAVETNSLLGAANLSLSADGVRLKSICRSVIVKINWHLIEDHGTPVTLCDAE